MMRHQTNIADVVREMSPDECEVFDLILDGYNPSKSEDIGEFVARIDTPIADLLVGLLEKRLLQKVETKGYSFLQINPAAVWFLAEPEYRTYAVKKPD
ncbi:hypothetical protein [Nisaea nitritireducens]|uniref:hypothetical protein n=1 Tax=Nisaea nitritireducens TaxID=568392 RepID=UPI001868CF9E|nr:hypothetical protein [Nisaea nitritireducens]